MKKTYIGGQAVIEGVMMRGKSMIALAVRNPEGGITVEDTKVTAVDARPKWMQVPIIRGVVAFVDSLYTGTKILMRSAELAGDDLDEEPGRLEAYLNEKFGKKTVYNFLVYLSVAVSLVLSVGLFMVLPVWVGNFLRPTCQGLGPYRLSNQPLSW